MTKMISDIYDAILENISCQRSLLVFRLAARNEKKDLMFLNFIIIYLLENNIVLV